MVVEVSLLDTTVTCLTCADAGKVYRHHPGLNGGRWELEECPEHICSPFCPLHACQDCPYKQRPEEEV